MCEPPLDLIVDESRGLVNIYLRTDTPFPIHFERAVSRYPEADQQFIRANWNEPFRRIECLQRTVKYRKRIYDFHELLSREKLGETRQERFRSNMERKRRSRENPDVRRREYELRCRNEEARRLKKLQSNTSSAPPSSAGFSSAPVSTSAGSEPSTIPSSSTNILDDANDSNTQVQGVTTTPNNLLDEDTEMIIDDDDDEEDAMHDDLSSDTADQNYIPLCAGHVYSNYGFLKHHYKPLTCSQSKIAAGLREKPIISQFTSVEDILCDIFNRAETKRNKHVFDEPDISTRKKMIEEMTPADEALYHIKLEDFLKYGDTLNADSTQKTQSDRTNKESTSSIFDELASVIGDFSDNNIEEPEIHSESVLDYDGSDKEELIQIDNYGLAQLKTLINGFIDELSLLYHFSKIGEHGPESAVLRHHCSFRTCGYASESRKRRRGLRVSSDFTRVPANCSGALDFCYNSRHKIIAIRHKHKHHMASIDRYTENVGVLVKYLEQLNKSYFLECLPKHMVVRVLCRLYPKFTNKQVCDLYDNKMRHKYQTFDADWFSLYKLCESMSDRCTTMVFHSESKTGFAIFLRPLIEKCADTADSIFFDSTRKTNDLKAELIVAYACVDNTGVPFAFMFLENTENVYKNCVEKAPYLVTKLGLTPECPLPQCETARDIVTNVEGISNDMDELKHTSKDTKGRANVIACMMRAISGIKVRSETTDVIFAKKTERFFDSIRSERLIRMTGDPGNQTLRTNAEEQIDTNNNHAVSNLQATVYSPLKVLTGIEVPLLIVGKDSSTIIASKITGQKNKILICQWYVLNSIKRRCKNGLRFENTAMRNRNVPKLDYPKEFNELVPSLSRRAFEQTHDPSECSRVLGLENYPHVDNNVNINININNDDDDDDDDDNLSTKGNMLCVAHNYEHYREWQDSPYSEQRPVKDNDDNNNENARFDDLLLSMVKRHSRCSSSTPQKFPQLKEKMYEEGRWYTPREIYELCVKEMVAFCVSHEKYAMLFYLWNNWYCDSQIKDWTIFWRDVDSKFATNLVAEQNPIILKRILFDHDGQERIDEFWFELNRVTLDDSYLAKVEMLTDATRGSYFNSYFCKYKPNWMLKRWNVIINLVYSVFQNDGLALKPELHTPEQYAADCQKHGTDAINFLCSCSEYVGTNVHLCKHLLRCINPSVFRNDTRNYCKVDLRPRKTPPFYLYPSATYDNLNDTELDVKRSTWRYALVNDDYLKFRENEGREILANKKSPYSANFRWNKDSEPDLQNREYALDIKDASETSKIIIPREMYANVAELMTMNFFFSTIGHPNARQKIYDEVKKAFNFIDTLLEVYERDNGTTSQPPVNTLNRRASEKATILKMSRKKREKTIMKVEAKAFERLEALPTLRLPKVCSRLKDAQARIRGELNR